MSHLFVYGTLMRGEERDGFVSHLDARQGSIMGRLWRAPAGYPALELTNQGTAIAGEILALDTPSILIALDLIEGVNELCHFTVTLVQLLVPGRWGGGGEGST